MLDPRRLLTIVEVGRRGSMGAAAQALGYTPSAVSQHVAALERQLGVTLVDRSPRGAQLTQAGHELVAQADRVLTAIQNAEGKVRAVAGLRSGRLRMGWFATAGPALMPRAIAAFRRRHPDVELGLTEGDPDRCSRLLRDEDIDLALVYDFALAPSLARDLRQDELLEDRLLVALTEAHPLARRRTLRLAELANEPWIQGVRGGSTREVLPTACAAAGFEPKIAFRTGNHAAMQGLVAAGVGIGLIPTIALANARPDIVVRPVSDPPLIRRVYAATRPGRTRSPSAQAMIAVLVDVARSAS